MAVTKNNADGVITLAATDAVTDQLSVDSIILYGTAAGAFVFKLGNATLTLSNTATNLSVHVPLNRTVNGITLTSGPTGAAMYVLLKKGV